ncbi:MAG: hypothetical protein EXS64_13800 [Candidatus Latescibacteria bacterium]|nr:hypothetical protein [Candidatus Latescibacterota bacterium]
MWDTLNTAIFSLGLAQFCASLIPTDFSRLGPDPAQTGFPLRYLLTGGHLFLFPAFSCLIFGALHLGLPPALIVSYAVKAGGIGGIIFSVLSILVFVRQWYRRGWAQQQDKKVSDH